jgi:hypothetical protein
LEGSKIGIIVGVGVAEALLLLVLSSMGISTAFGVVFTYAAASVFFWHYPHLLHKKKRVSFTPTHISHRGGEIQFIYSNECDLA